MKISNRRLIRLALMLFIAIATCCSLLLAQNPQLQTKNGGRFPTIVFSSVLWSANPSYYSFAVDSMGAATYQSAPDSVDTTGVPYTVVFQADDATRRIIFNLSRNVDYFRGEIAVSLGSPQNSPVRTLAYHDLTFDNQITFTDSTDPQIQELLSVFQEVSATLEFGRRLAYLHQHDAAKLESELAAMHKSAERHRLRELQAVAAVLRSITADEHLSSEIRAEAQAVLDQHQLKAGSGPQLTTAPGSAN
jgi:hypothetical protein